MDTEPAGRAAETTWLQSALSAQPALTVITESERVRVYAPMPVCTVSVWRAGLAAQIKPEARPLGESRGWRVVPLKRRPFE